MRSLVIIVVLVLGYLGYEYVYKTKPTPFCIQTASRMSSFVKEFERAVIFMNDKSNINSSEKKLLDQKIATLKEREAKFQSFFSKRRLPTKKWNELCGEVSVNLNQLDVMLEEFKKQLNYSE